MCKAIGKVIGNSCHLHGFVWKAGFLSLGICPKPSYRAVSKNLTTVKSQILISNSTQTFVFQLALWSHSSMPRNSAGLLCTCLLPRCNQSFPALAPRVPSHHQTQTAGYWLKIHAIICVNFNHIVPTVPLGSEIITILQTLKEVCGASQCCIRERFPKGNSGNNWCLHEALSDAEQILYGFYRISINIGFKLF